MAIPDRFITRALVRLALPAAAFIAGVFTTHAVLAAPPGKGNMQLTSSAFKDRDAIPAQYTCEDKNISPPLQWTGVPASAKSLVLIVDDPDAPGGTWVHWVIYDLPAATSELTAEIPKGEAIPGGGKQGVNDFKKPGYGGPCPPAGKAHRYFFRLYALDASLNLKAGATKNEVEGAMAKHIVGQTQLMGTCQKK